MPIFHTESWLYSTQRAGCILQRELIFFTQRTGCILRRELAVIYKESWFFYTENWLYSTQRAGCILHREQDVFHEGGAVDDVFIEKYWLCFAGSCSFITQKPAALQYYQERRSSLGQKAASVYCTCKAAIVLRRKLHIYYLDSCSFAQKASAVLHKRLTLHGSTINPVTRMYTQYVECIILAVCRFVYTGLQLYSTPSRRQWTYVNFSPVFLFQNVISANFPARQWWPLPPLLHKVTRTACFSTREKHNYRVQPHCLTAWPRDLCMGGPAMVLLHTYSKKTTAGSLSGYAACLHPESQNISFGYGANQHQDMHLLPSSGNVTYLRQACSIHSSG